MDIWSIRNGSKPTVDTVLKDVRHANLGHVRSSSPIHLYSFWFQNMLENIHEQISISHIKIGTQIDFVVWLEKLNCLFRANTNQRAIFILYIILILK